MKTHPTARILLSVSAEDIRPLSFATPVSVLFCMDARLRFWMFLPMYHRQCKDEEICSRLREMTSELGIQVWNLSADKGANAGINSDILSTVHRVRDGRAGDRRSGIV